MDTKLPQCVITGKKVTKATLYFYVNAEAGGPSKYIEIKNVSASWAESINWNNKVDPAGGYSGKAFQQPANNGWINLDVTSLITNWFNGAGESWLWRYVNDSTECTAGQWFTQFKDRISVTYKPYVVVEY
jgi:hypothetical protein